MLIHELQPKRERAQARVGRGGKRGTTAGRGQKGQRAHAGRRIKRADHDLIQRLPKLRGYRNKPLAKTRAVVNVKNIGAMKEIPRGVKVLGGGDISRPVIVRGDISRAAREKVIKAGGTVLRTI
jgi:large subunit ribosomal protein L15